MTPQELYDTLKPVQEKKGYFFNNDKSHALKLLEGLLANKERYGYMSCPCRLAAGDREWDKDIICPCHYREADVKDYGSCYCNLYVSQEWNEGKTQRAYVPERRPSEKCFVDPRDTADALPHFGRPGGLLPRIVDAG